MMEFNERTEALAYAYLLFLGLVSIIGAAFDRHGGMSLLLGTLYIVVSARQLVAHRGILVPAYQKQRDSR